MTGAEHYREAVRLLNMLPSHGINHETGLDRAETLAAAQAHAILALTAASTEPWAYETSDRTGEHLHPDWVEVLS